MSLDMERLIRVNFATVEDLQRLPHIGPKVAYAIITLRESHGNLTFHTLQTFLRTKFDAETLEMLDFTRNVSLPVLQMPHKQFDLEGGGKLGCLLYIIAIFSYHLYYLTSNYNYYYYYHHHCFSFYYYFISVFILFFSFFPSSFS